VVRVQLAGRAAGRLESVRVRLAAAGLDVAGVSATLRDALDRDVDVVIALDDVAEAEAAADRDGPAVLAVGDERTVSVLARAGHAAWGVVPPAASSDDLAAAATALARGLLVLPAESAHLLARGSAVDDEEDAAAVEPLTAREREVLELASRGLSNREVAAALSISEHTVKFHLASIYGKLGAGSRTEAVRRGVRRGLITI
jgi:DNA-binding NarL/FixJ family response regulator